MPPSNATVIRFSPIAPDRLLARAEQEYRRSARYGISVFAAAPDGTEDQDRLIQRILEASELQNVKPETNQKFWWLAEASAIYDLGYTFCKAGFLGEIDLHYSLLLGEAPTLEDSKRISDLFQPRKREQ
ncbi:hypothetical protein CH282_15255 [Rhodococcus sp. 06-418-1B]|nr:hypothetical protein CH282_15255 [Rhodococcus sp. 06-418-1B]